MKTAGVAVDAARVASAVDVLRRGGLVALPTETVYGLAADAANDLAVKAIFAAKGRPADHPLIVHVSDVDQAERWAAQIGADARKLMGAFWPGPLTLVVERRPSIGALVSAGQATIALRSPAHPWARAVLRAFGGALAAPSANRFGRVSPTTAGHVLDDLGLKPQGAIDLILDGGPCPIGIESTIVDCSGVQVQLLRPGAVSRESMQQVLGAAVVDAGAAAPRASGRLEQHYAPRTPLEIVPLQQLAARLTELQRARVGMLAIEAAASSATQAIEAAMTDPGRIVCITAPADADRYATALYANLHRLDALGLERILVQEPPQTPNWEAVNDRLRRAAATHR